MADVNNLHARASSPPPIFADIHQNRLEKISKNIEKHLSELKIDWLVERYKELSPEMRKLFLSRIQI